MICFSDVTMVKTTGKAIITVDGVEGEHNYLRDIDGNIIIEVNHDVEDIEECLVHVVLKDGLNSTYMGVIIDGCVVTNK